METSIMFFVAIFIFAITPGPGTFALISRALVFGAWASFPMAVGIIISDITYLVFATLGLATIAEKYRDLFTIIRLIGAVYLVYLGWKMWTAEVNTTLNINETGNGLKKLKWLSSFIQGVAISASNPKVILFYIAFLPTFINIAVLNSSDVIFLSILTFFALIAGLMLVSIAASSIRHYFKSASALQKLNQVAGSIMIGAGIFLALKN